MPIPLKRKQDLDVFRAEGYPEPQIVEKPTRCIEPIVRGTFGNAVLDRCRRWATPGTAFCSGHQKYAHEPERDDVPDLVEFLGASDDERRKYAEEMGS